MIHTADKSQDGKIAWHEFLNLMIGEGQNVLDSLKQEEIVDIRIGSNEQGEWNIGRMSF
jgi:hypothetical protein